MKDEIIINVDENDNEIGFIEKLDAHIKGVLHRAISVFIFNDNKELLLQKRFSGKYHSPVFGPILAVLILIKMKIQKMQQIDV